MFGFIKNILYRFFSISPRLFFRTIALCARHPLLSILCVYATVQSYKIASRLYPATHGKDGKANAFRHALWTSMIANYCSKITSPQKAIGFSKKITDLHEDIFPNPVLQRAMDLHNNRIGLLVFGNILQGVHRQFIEKQFLVDALKMMVPNARFVDKETDIHGDELVYISKH